MICHESNELRNEYAERMTIIHLFLPRVCAEGYDRDRLSVCVCVYVSVCMCASGSQREILVFV